MSSITIYHNNRCGTSRKVLEMIQESGLEPEIIFYLETPPTREQLRHLLTKMKFSANDLLRKKEALYKELGLDQNSVSEEEIISAMLTHPILIERPIVISELGVKLCRPAELVLELLPKK